MVHLCRLMANGLLILKIYLDSFQHCNSTIQATMSVGWILNNRYGGPMEGICDIIINSISCNYIVSMATIVLTGMIQKTWLVCDVILSNGDVNKG